MNLNKKLLNAIFIITAGVLICGFIILYFLRDKDNTESVTMTTTETTVQEETVVIPIDFDNLWQNNDDIVAWIKIEGTNVDYPILQSDEDMEENYYLNTTPEGNSGYPGSIFIQKKNNKDFSDRVMAVYGHNMANKTMFGSLHYFNNREFFDTYNTIFVYTPENILEYKVFAAYKSDNESIMGMYEEFSDKGKLKEYLDFIFNQEESDLNHFNKELDITENDRIIILTTCIGNPNYRWRIVGALVN